MRKVLAIILLVSSLFGGEIKWAKDFNSGVEQAKKASKPILFVSSRHSCRFCVILEETTFKDKKVIDELNKNFISIISYSDENDYMPDELWRPGTPAIWFLKSNGEPMYQPLMGAIDAPNFLQGISIVKDEFKKIGKK